ncbi:MAG: adenylosuccinate synthetase, partial [Methylobacteriaceae bacterium]|nr:adenylosuccinate synthetase [Methylobacteriaceae bacterium]
SRIRAEWLPRRLASLRAWPIEAADAAIVGSDGVLEHWLDDAEAFLDAVNVCGAQVLARAGAVVFEGAQGLMLDQHRGAFPYVTRSNTGLKNVLALAAETGIAGLDVVYATRAYVTRHGAGPLAHELDGPPSAAVVDATNIANPWQGRLRFGTLDLQILASAIAADLADAASSGIAVSHRLAVTCLDQIGAATDFVEGGEVRRASPEGLAAAAADAVGARRLMTSFGPTRDTICVSQEGGMRAAASTANRTTASMKPILVIPEARSAIRDPAPDPGSPLRSGRDDANTTEPIRPVVSAGVGQ